MTPTNDEEDKKNSLLTNGETFASTPIPAYYCTGICEEKLKEPFCPCMSDHGRGSFKGNKNLYMKEST